MVAHNGQLKEIRAYQRQRDREGANPREIAHELLARWQGITRLESWRHGRGWTLAKAAEQIALRLERPLCSARTQEPGLTPERLSEWEHFPSSGERPGHDYLWAMKVTYGITLEETGLFDWHTGAGADHAELDETPERRDAALVRPPVEGGSSTDRRDFMTWTAAGVAAFVAETARESIRLGQTVEVTNVGDTTLEQYQQEVARLATDYDQSPRLQVFVPARELRDEVFALINGRQYPDQTRDLYLIAGQLCGLLAQASLNLGAPYWATTQARTTWRLADLAGHSGLRAWARGTQSLVAYRCGDPEGATRFARAGRRFATSGTAMVRLAGMEARARASLGDLSGTEQALNIAKDAREQASTPDMLGGIFTFNDARQAFFAGDCYVSFHRVELLRMAEAEAIESIRRYEAGPLEERSFGDMAMARLVIADARFHQGDLEGAYEAARPALALPPEYRITQMVERFGSLDRQLTASKYRSDPLALEFRDQIRAISAPATAN